MRIIISLFIIFISNILNSQMTLENTLTGIYNRSDNKEFNLSLNGNNSFIYKKIKLDNSTNYQLSLSDKIKSNEFLNRNSISITSKKRYFIFHQYNYSSNRKTNSNFIGAGFFFFTTKDTNNIVTFSYASVFENVYNFDLNNTNSNFRHSFKMKMKLKNNAYLVTSEYFYQPVMIDINNYLIFGNTTITFPVRKWLGVSLVDNINYNKNSEVKIIHTITLGIQIKFEK